LVPTCEKYFLKILALQAVAVEKSKKILPDFQHIASTMLRGSFGKLAGFPEELSKDSRRTSLRIQNEYRINTDKPEKYLSLISLFFFLSFFKNLFTGLSPCLSNC